MSTEVQVDEAFAQGVAAVRNDDSPVNWVLGDHPDGNVNMLVLEGTDSDGLDGLVDRLMDSKSQYALVRLTEDIDMSATVKFVYIRWRGKDTSFKTASKLGVIKGSVESYFSPYHCVIETDTKDELTDEYVMTKLQEQSGQRSKVLEATVAKTRPERGFTSGTSTKADATGSAPSQGGHVGKIGKMGSSFTGMTGMAKASGGFKTDSDVASAVMRVGSDQDDAKWCVAGFVENNPKKQLTLVATGDGDLEEFASQFSCDSVANKILFGYVRVSDEIDGISTVKFAFVQWVGEEVRAMNKAKISTQKGALENIFKPTHVTIYANQSREVTSHIIQDKVASASGSKINIKP